MCNKIMLSMTHSPDFAKKITKISMCVFVYVCNDKFLKKITINAKKK